ncbi:MAG: cytochrome c [Verrucomicrobia bacterium]|nr:cytochrome c [Verrucomicrobiota bacterium]MDA1066451.1 cytochrome c [Verrucomicrobiota bacterium]
MRYFLFAFALAVAAVVSILGFRGGSFTKPPLEMFPDMDDQSKYKPQGTSTFFADGRTDRLPIAGTVARGLLKDDEFLHFGKKGEEWARGFPMPVTDDLINRGKERYGIYCAVCHGGVGDGNGVTKPRGMNIVASFHDDRLRDIAEGEIFNTLTNGKGLMGYYRDKLSAEDRWAVIAYLRVIQRSQNASVNDVPPANRKDLGL